jgi:hypothetical protein
MTDEELVKRLRELRNNQYADPSTAPEFVFLDPDLPPSEWEKQYSMDVVYVRADRIEALTEQLEAARADAKEAEAYAEELEAKLATCEEIGRAFEEDAGQLRAKLAKAVDWFETIRDRAKGDYMAHTYYLDALAALTTIKRREP